MSHEPELTDLSAALPFDLEGSFGDLARVCLRMSLTPSAIRGAPTCEIAFACHGEWLAPFSIPAGIELTIKGRRSR